jgi:neopullulanase
MIRSTISLIFLPIKHGFKEPNSAANQRFYFAKYSGTLFAILAVFFLVSSISSQTPQFSNVEPPNWWANHTINPVRLLVQGENFQNAKVVSKNPQLKVSNVRVNKNSTYLFFDVTIPPTIKPAKYEFAVSTDKGKSLIPFEILPLPKTPKTITNDDIIYLIMTDRFSDGDPANNVNVDKSNPRAWHGGDFRGVLNHLDYLKELGITAIWLTPWYDNTDEITNCDKPWCPMASYHGYGATDYYGVENHFGTLAELKELIGKANAMGIKVVQDQVANHVGYKHAWIKNPPLENWFPPFTQNKFNNSTILSPNASQADVDNMLKGWFDFTLPDLNQEEPEVAKYEIQNALWWIGTTGISGIRQDTIQYMPRWFIRDLNLAIQKQYPKFYMVGEVFEEDSAQTAFFQGGKTGWDGIDTKLPSVFDFKLWRTSLEVFTGKKPMRALRDVQKYDGLYGDINRVTVMTNNHDTKRFMSLEGATKEGAKLHTAFILATRGIPQLYYGEEVAMLGGDDPFNRGDFVKFDKSGLSKDESNVYWFTRNWIDIRKTYPALRLGKTIDLYYDNDFYVFARQYKEETIVIAINRGNADASVQIDEKNLGFTKGKYNYGANGSNLKKECREKSDVFSENGIVSLTIPANNIIAFDVKKVLN